MVLDSAGIQNPYTANLSYQEQWKEHLSHSLPHIVIHDAIILDSDDVPPAARTSAAPEDQLWVVACGSDGTVYVWTVPSDAASNESRSEEGGEWEQTTSEGGDDPDSPSFQNSQLSLLQPRHRWKLHRGALTKLQIFPSAAVATDDSPSSAAASPRLFVAGDICGVLEFDWNRLVHDGCEGEALRPLAHYEPYPSSPLSPSVAAPVRDFVVHSRVLTAAVGDEWGLYQWNLDTGARILTGYRHGPVASLARLKTGLLVTSEKGVASIQSGTKADWADLDLRPLLAAASAPQIGKRQDPPPDLRLTCATAVNDCWWTVGGRSIAGGGFVATVHAPTSSVVSRVATPDVPQRLLCCCYARGSPSLASASNAPIIRLWHPVTLEPQTWWRMASIPSAHALVACGEFVAVGGVGGILEVFHRSTRILALTCHY